MRSAWSGLAFFLMVGACLAADSDAAKKEKERLKGIWTVVRMERNAHDAPADEYAEMTMEFTEDRLLIHRGAKTDPREYRIDPSKKPKAMDLTHPETKYSVQAIYQLSGDKLQICFERSGKPRPLTFDSKSGDFRILWILKRENS